MEIRWPLLFLIIVSCFLIWMHFFFLPYQFSSGNNGPLYKMHENHTRSLKYKMIASDFTKHCENLKKLKTILLAINYNFPHFSGVLILRKFYEPIFGKVIFCGQVEDEKFGVIKIPENKGYQGYECVATAIRKYPHYRGYIHSNDDVILNWWNLMKLDTTKIWLGGEMNYKTARRFGTPIDKTWYWWAAENTAHLCEVAFNKVSSLENTQEGISIDLKRHLRQFYTNTKNEKLCLSGWSDFFYIPRKYSNAYAYLSSIYASLKVYLEATVPTILTFFIDGTNHYVLNGMYYNNIYGYSPKYYSGEAFYETYSLGLNFSHPFKLEGQMKIANRKFFSEVIMSHGESVRHFCSLFDGHQRRKRSAKKL